MVYEIARNLMIENQIRTNKVTDKIVISAINKVPRELFLPKDKKDIAYMDEDIHIGYGRYMMKPMIIARLLQSVNICKKDIVLAIGSGFGYTGALLSKIAGKVIALEKKDELSQYAKKIFQKEKYENIFAVKGELNTGFSN